MLCALSPRVLADAFCVEFSGDAACDLVSVSVFGDSTANYAISLFGHARSACVGIGCTAISGAGNANGWVAFSFLGEASGLVAAAGWGSSTGLVAVTLFGYAEGVAAVTLDGRSSGIIAVSVFGQATTVCDTQICREVEVCSLCPFVQPPPPPPVWEQPMDELSLPTEREFTQSVYPVVLPFVSKREISIPDIAMPNPCKICEGAALEPIVFSTPALELSERTTPGASVGAVCLNGPGCIGPIRIPPTTVPATSIEPIRVESLSIELPGSCATLSLCPGTLLVAGQTVGETPPAGGNEVVPFTQIAVRISSFTFDLIPGGETPVIEGRVQVSVKSGGEDVELGVPPG
jgi:hypothetical protein